MLTDHDLLRNPMILSLSGCKIQCFWLILPVFFFWFVFVFMFLFSFVLSFFLFLGYGYIYICCYTHYIILLLIVVKYYDLKWRVFCFKNITHIITKKNLKTHSQTKKQEWLLGLNCWSIVANTISMVTCQSSRCLCNKFERSFWTLDCKCTLAYCH